MPGVLLRLPPGLDGRVDEKNQRPVLFTWEVNFLFSIYKNWKNKFHLRNNTSLAVLQGCV